MVSCSLSTTACSMQFSSCRTLPGHSAPSSSSSARGVSRGTRLWCAAENFRRKCSTSSPMSPRRARSGGTSIITTAIR